MKNIQSLYGAVDNFPMTFITWLRLKPPVPSFQTLFTIAVPVGEEARVSVGQLVLGYGLTKVLSKMHSRAMSCRQPLKHTSDQCSTVAWSLNNLLRCPDWRWQ